MCTASVPRHDEQKLPMHQEVKLLDYMHAREQSPPSFLVGAGNGLAVPLVCFPGAR